MIKIGILGTDNTHAGEFARLANTAVNGKYLHEDVRVTHVYGHNEAETKHLAECYNIQNIVSDPSEMLGAVDAVMVVFRDGKYHFPHAKPFIERGLPIWIDKPITIEVEECEQLLALSKKHGSVISGGSNCKYSRELRRVKQYLNGYKNVVTAMLNFPIYLDSIYSGMHFYAAHLVEMATELFGFDIKSVYAHASGENVNVLCEYADFDVHLCYTHQAAQYSCYLIEERSNTKFDVTLCDIAEIAFEKFIESIKTGRTEYPQINLLKVTAIVDAIKRSYNTSQRVIVPSFE